MRSIISFLASAGDGKLLMLAAAICVAGVYASYSLAAHAARCGGRDRRVWSITSVAAAGGTAWATHMIGLLALRPGETAVFEPIMTVLSMLTGTAGIGAGIAMIMQSRGVLHRLLAGVVLGSGIAALHYFGLAGYVVHGRIVWNLGLAFLSLVIGVLICGLAMIAAGARLRNARKMAAPLLIIAIAVIHFTGTDAAKVVHDPSISLPLDGVTPSFIAPLVAGVSVWLVVMAAIGLRFTSQAQARLRRDRQRVVELTALALEGLAVTDGKVILTANPSLGRMYGADPIAMEGLLVSMLLPNFDVSQARALEERDVHLLSAAGERIPVRLLRSEVELGSKQRIVLALRDQRERLSTEARLERLAYSDALTGLANRGRFHDLLTLHTVSRRERDHNFAVLMVDLDRFKPVNDLLGHAAGDAVLRITAERLQSTLRETDVLGRLGGDEFAILQVDAGGEKAARALAERIVELMSLPMRVNDQSVHVGASIGIALSPSHGEEAEVLLHNADLALYSAKSEGRGQFQLFDPELDARMQARRRMEVELRSAVSSGEMEVYYQPLVEAGSGKISGAEALVRWNHPERGLVPPTEFISLAEETGLIVPLGSWVLHQACMEAASWSDALSIAVNLSPVQFRDRNLANIVREALRETGLPGDRLELEITEGVLLADEVQTLATLEELRAEGVRISMDDFGTGYSSLSYLRRFPFDKIKVDQSFVSQLPHNAESVAIVRAILSMGACLGMTTTVEGVETREQMAFSAAEGCTYVQGYLVSRPLDASAFRHFIASRPKAISLERCDVQLT